MAKDEHRCQYCLKAFCRNSALRIHVRSVHPGKEAPVCRRRGRQVSNAEMLEKCCHCNKSYSRTTMARHIREQHHTKRQGKSIPKAAAKVSEVATHLAKPNAEGRKKRKKILSGEEISLSFSSLTDFLKWKTVEEDKTTSHYVKKRRDTKYINGDTRRVYYCHRDGVFKSRGNSIRKEKVNGTCKIGFRCPALMVLRIALSGEVLVKYNKMHRGHLCDVGHQRVNREKRLEIAGLLSMGVSFDDVLDKIELEMCGDEVCALDLVDKQFLINIQRDFNIHSEASFAKKDIDSVIAWVDSTRHNVSDPNLVRFIKYQGDPSPSGVALDTTDFMLVIITRAQLTWLQKFGGEMKEVAMDSTHGMNEYKFQLTTLLLIDDHGEGIPGAFCYSSRVDEVAMVTFLRVCRDAIGEPLKNVVLMTDGAEVYYNAWNVVMGSPHAWLLCVWHVDRCWRKNLARIQGNQELKVQIYKTVRFLLVCKDKDAFGIALQNFLKACACDPALVDFGEYFRGEYANHPERWACCHRLGLRVYHNMHLEALHRVIKHVYLQGHKVKRMDKSIFALMRLLRGKVRDRKIKLYKGKWTKHVRSIDKKHQLSLEMDASGCVCVQENTSYLVYGSGEEMYMVEHGDCMDSSLRETICKHVHLVVRLFNPHPLCTGWPDMMYVDMLDNGDSQVEVVTEIDVTDNVEGFVAGDHMSDVPGSLLVPLPSSEEPQDVSSVPGVLGLADEARVLQSVTSRGSVVSFQTCRDLCKRLNEFIDNFEAKGEQGLTHNVVSILNRAVSSISALEARPSVPEFPLSTSREPANKKIEPQRNFTVAGSKLGRKRKACESLSKPSREEIDVFMQTIACRAVNCPPTDHDYFRTN